MINISSLPTLYYYFANVLEFGLKNEYSFSSIEDYISFSDMFNHLEKSDDSFLYRRTITKELELIYLIPVKDDEVENVGSKALWLGEAYMRLFFEYHKPIYYIFLYMPISDMLNYYSLYHEMDWNQLYALFKEKTKEVPLLKKLIEKNNLSINKLSQLTSISVNTIKWYSLSDDNLYKASYENIYNISIVLKVNSNIFVREINNYTNSEGYEFDMTNLKYRSYLGLYIASYYSNEINNRKYKYDESKHMFYSSDYTLSVLWINPSDASGQTISDLINDYSKNIPLVARKNHTIIIFEYGDDVSIEAKPLHKLVKYGFEQYYIINTKNVIFISDNNYWLSSLTDSVRKEIIAKAKKDSGGDFGI